MSEDRDLLEQLETVNAEVKALSDKLSEVSGSLASFESLSDAVTDCTKRIALKEKHKTHMHACDCVFQLHIHQLVSEQGKLIALLQTQHQKLQELMNALQCARNTPSS